MLAKLDAKKPKQANLRRAVSSAYYAVFHYLVHEACSVQIGSQHGQAPYRHALGRAFTHSVMKLACTSFAGGTLKLQSSKVFHAMRQAITRFRSDSVHHFHFCGASGLAPVLISSDGIDFQNALRHPLGSHFGLR